MRFVSPGSTGLVLIRIRSLHLLSFSLFSSLVKSGTCFSFNITIMKFLAALVAGGLSGLALAAPTATINQLEKRASANDVCSSDEIGD
jgi:hypothetical protein